MSDGNSCPRACSTIMPMNNVITTSTSRLVRQNRFRFKDKGNDTVLRLTSLARFVKTRLQGRRSSSRSLIVFARKLTLDSPGCRTCSESADLGSHSNQSNFSRSANVGATKPCQGGANKNENVENNRRSVIAEPTVVAAAVTGGRSGKICRR
jgi:hypothetical protein